MTLAGLGFFAGALAGTPGMAADGDPAPTAPVTEILSAFRAVCDHYPSPPTAKERAQSLGWQPVTAASNSLAAQISRTTDAKSIAAEKSEDGSPVRMEMLEKRVAGRDALLALVTSGSLTFRPGRGFCMVGIPEEIRLVADDVRQAFKLGPGLEKAGPGEDRKYSWRGGIAEGQGLFTLEITHNPVWDPEKPRGAAMITYFEAGPEFDAINASVPAEKSDNVHAASPYEVYQQACRNLGNYDALHAANLQQGWTYLGVDDPRFARLDALATTARTSNPAMQAIMPVMGGVLGSILSEGEHRRVYGRIIDGRKMLLKNIYRRGFEVNGAQVNCSLVFEAPDGVPSNETLIAAMGRKPDEKTNFKREAGKPVMLIWRTSKAVRVFAYEPKRLPVAIANYGLAELTDTIPAEGDPPFPGKATEPTTQNR